MRSRRSWLSGLAGVVLLTDGKYALAAGDTVGKEVPDDLYVGSAKTIKVGTVASPSSITKTLRVPAAEIVPMDDTQKWDLGPVSDVRPRAINTPLNLRAAMVMPYGIQITAIRFRGYRQTVNDTANCSLSRVENDTTVTIATLTHATTGWATTSASTAEDATVGRTYVIVIGLTGVAAVANARFGWFELDYTMPSYDKGY